MLQSLATKASERHAATIADYPLFDWLRFALASVVALGHAKIVTWGSAGNLAVQVFFALSGFLIGSILLRSKPRDLPRFFFNRATRIWLPYFAAVALLYAVSLAREPLTWRWIEFLFYDATFTHNWFSLRPDAAIALSQMPLQGTANHFWSLAVEEQFYLIAPLLIVVGLVGRHWLFWLLTAIGFMLLTLPDFASISLGVMLANIGQPGRLRLLACVPLAVSAIVLTYGTHYEYAAPCFAISAVTVCTVPGHRTSIGTFLGGVSYPMYLNHWIGIFVAHGIAKHHIEIITPMAEGLIGYCGGVSAGVIAYLLIDRVVMRERNRFFSPTLGITLACVGYSIVIIGLTFGIWRWHLT